MFEKGDIVQIIDKEHGWYPSLLIVDEPKSWGIQGYTLIPKSNDGSEPVATAYNRLLNEQIEKVGVASIHEEN